ncbi:SDR family NAD(P)-dependent oxidoreductase [Streptomyces sp. NPDC059009]|uniref:SDR family NAD(P)-dependent oxidoreductase n=1 Tax=Streptomyces sp. NPDC059009 TaxID=3346694 RepID=UPI00369F7617
MNGPYAEREFAGRTALVTGAASGIGRAVARRLAQGGAAVAVADRDEEGAAKAAAELTATGAHAIPVPADVTDPDQVRTAVETTVSVFGALHLAVNNAGVAGPTALTADVELADWRRVVDVNLHGVFHCLRAEIPALLAAGGGAIVNMSSVLGANGFMGSAAYSAAKHAVVGLTKTAAIEYAAQGIRVNAVGPGFVDTPLLADADTGVRDLLTSLHPAGRLGTPEEVAELTAFLLSDRASFLHGGHYLADGAYAAQ